MPWVTGLTVRVLTYEGARTGHSTLVDAMVELVQREGLSGITVTRALEGNSQHVLSRLSTTANAGDDLPLIIEIVDRDECIEPLLAAIASLVTSGTVTVTDARVYFPATKVVVKDVMLPPGFTARADTSLAQVLVALVEGGARLVPVVGEGGALQGVITLSTLLQKIDPSLAIHLTEKQTPEHVRMHLQRLVAGHSAHDCMLRSPAVLPPMASLERAARHLAAHHITRVPVVDEGRRVIGVVGEHEIIAALVMPLKTDARSNPTDAVAPLRRSVMPGAGQQLIAGVLAEREVPRLPRAAPADEVLRAIEAAPHNVAFIVDSGGRLCGLIDERAILQRAVPGPHGGIGNWVTHLLSRSSFDVLSLLRHGGARTLTAEALMRPVRPTVLETMPVAEALAEMINASHSDLAGVVTPDRQPVGILWRHDALRALVGG